LLGVLFVYKPANLSKSKLIQWVQLLHPNGFFRDFFYHQKVPLPCEATSASITTTSLRKTDGDTVFNTRIAGKRTAAFSENLSSLRDLFYISVRPGLGCFFQFSTKEKLICRQI